MKVLIVFKETGNDNPYVSTLKKSLLAEGLEVTCNVDDFWNNYRSYDIIHFQWPESLVNGRLDHELYLRITGHISLVKSFCTIIATCHNLESHYSNNKYKGLLYEYIYSNSDAVIHLGIYSYEYLKNKFPNIKHYIIPHHVYDDLYHFALSKSEARKKLKIPESASVLLCFGSFRNDEEREMVLGAFKKTELPDKYLLAPGFHRFRRNVILGYKAFFKAIFYKLKGIHFVNHFLSDNEVELYLCAADVLMIQRKKILNSGNLSLGFWAKKVVIGPDTGNVGRFLKKTGNPVFNPDDSDSVVSAVRKGFQLRNSDLPERNYYYAYNNWRTTNIGRQHVEIYVSLKNI